MNLLTLKIPIFDLGGRWSLRDLASFVGDAQPKGDDGDPFEQLLRDAKACGVRVLDLRGIDRKLHHGMRTHCIQGDHDFGAWGYFRDDDPKRNLPIRGRAHGRIAWPKRTTIMLHTTAVIRMAAPRFLGTPAHAAIAYDGTIVLMQPSDAFMWHGHAGNRFSIGVEIAGKSSIEQHQIEPARALLRYLHDDRQTHHEAQMAIMQHGMAHKSRHPQDCGRAVWEAVAVPAIAELDLKIGPVVGSGSMPEWLAAA